jgi:hypothetical protein
MPRAFTLVLLLGAGCRRAAPAPGGSDQGVLTVQWTGSATGRFSTAAEARWCVRDTLLEVVAARSDTAIGLSLIAQDSLRTGGYPVFHADVYAPWRPQAGVALRWLDSADLRHFGGARGQVTLTEGGSRRVSGTLDLMLNAPPGRDTLHLTGSFTGLAVTPASGACGRANKPGPG